MKDNYFEKNFGKKSHSNIHALIQKLIKHMGKGVKLLGRGWLGTKVAFGEMPEMNTKISIMGNRSS